MNQIQFCAICGSRPATTRDHVPPAGIFPKPRPSDLITVPCCRQCNCDASKWDELFRVYAAMHVSREDPSCMKLLESSVLPTVCHNRRLRSEILASAQDVMLKTPSGLSLGSAVKIPWDSEAFDRVVERTIRGLHFHHTGDILGERATVRVHFYENLNAVGPAFDGLPLHAIGSGQLLYKAAYFPEVPLRSAWVFQYRKLLCFGGYVEPHKVDAESCA